MAAAGRQDELHIFIKQLKASGHTEEDISRAIIIAKNPDLLRFVRSNIDVVLDGTDEEVETLVNRTFGVGNKVEFLEHESAAVEKMCQGWSLGQKHQMYAVLKAIKGEKRFDSPYKEGWLNEVDLNDVYEAVERRAAHDAEWEVFGREYFEGKDKYQYLMAINTYQDEEVIAYEDGDYIDAFDVDSEYPIHMLDGIGARAPQAKVHPDVSYRSRDALDLEEYGPGDYLFVENPKMLRNMQKSDIEVVRVATQKEAFAKSELKDIVQHGIWFFGTIKEREEDEESDEEEPEEPKVSQFAPVHLGAKHVYQAIKSGPGKDICLSSKYKTKTFNCLKECGVLRETRKPRYTPRPQANDTVDGPEERKEPMSYQKHPRVRSRQPQPKPAQACSDTRSLDLLRKILMEKPTATTLANHAKFDQEHKRIFSDPGFNGSGKNKLTKQVLDHIGMDVVYPEDLLNSVRRMIQMRGFRCHDLTPVALMLITKISGSLTLDQREDGAFVIMRS